ncbi:Lsr2 family protein [Pseudonocardia sp. KRD-184]|uniref:Lsr2 family protein n=1 Tax=Pseudonocardia oceani TaxID=2792013 RepID=A0ABS6U382_9PSEU|nr:Lsr2 family protein [Pseudonocardia oceani]MBW0091262.1 Lsr2 family protein [Pseudonocardia oceani]MBW0098379.1 Lsr2 family protein [Pseudonocardia oceani]MBW0110850.1 Lsr2 family protein [Pseudonocardia oceani]MBW0119777.1 Lsr2 family protein [Pseudonocardia oceani]MBW0126707.1 Lsr2 family protein [Pseudonocardia oceani]
MAKQVVETLVDDLDGSEAEETVSFAIDGRQFEIDLNAAHASELRDVIAPFVGAARRAGGGTARRTPQRASTSTKSKEENAAIRAWAMANGLEVSERGRMSSAVLTAYENRGNAPVEPEPVVEAEPVAEEKPKRRTRRKATVDA